MQEKNISRKKIKAHEKYTAKELPKLTQAFNKYSENPRAKLMQCTSPRLSTPAGSLPALLYHVLPTRSLATSARSNLDEVQSPTHLLTSPPASPGSRDALAWFPTKLSEAPPPGAPDRRLPPQGQAPNCPRTFNPHSPGHLPPRPASAPSYPAARLVTVLTAAPYTLPDPTPPPRPRATALPQAPALCHPGAAVTRVTARRGRSAPLRAGAPGPPRSGPPAHLLGPRYCAAWLPAPPWARVQPPRRCGARGHRAEEPRPSRRGRAAPVPASARPPPPNRRRREPRTRGWGGGGAGAGCGWEREGRDWLRMRAPTRTRSALGAARGPRGLSEARPRPADTHLQAAAAAPGHRAGRRRRGGQEAAGRSDQLRGLPRPLPETHTCRAPERWAPVPGLGHH